MSQPDENNAGVSPRGTASVDEASDERTQQLPRDAAAADSGSGRHASPNTGEPSRPEESSASAAPSRPAEQSAPVEQAAPAKPAAAAAPIPERLKPSPGVSERSAGSPPRPPRPASTVTVTSSGSRPAGGAGGAAAAGAAGAAATRASAPQRQARQARLALTRIDPWSVLKLSLVLSLALFVVGLVAVMVLYFVLEGMGVPDALNEMVADVTADPETGAAAGEVLSLGRVFALSVVVGAVNVVLMTALATLGAFLYNLCADVVGGVDVTLSERE